MADVDERNHNSDSDHSTEDNIVNGILVDQRSHVVSETSAVVRTVSNDEAIDESISKKRSHENGKNDEKHSKQKLQDNNTNETILTHTTSNENELFSVRIDGFLRPFTFKQAREMVEDRANSSMLEGSNGFWMDSIKTYAIATFDTVSSMQTAKDNIDTLIWPESTGRALSVSFSDKHAGDMTGGAGERFNVASQDGIELERQKRAEAKASLMKRRDAKQEKVDQSIGDDRIKGLGVNTLSKSSSTTTSSRPVVKPVVKGRGMIRSLKPPAAITVDQIFMQTDVQPSVFWLPASEEIIQVRKEMIAQEKKRGEPSL